MSDNEILAGLMRRILNQGVRLTEYSDRGPTITLDDRPFSVGHEEIEAIRRAVEGERRTA